VQHGSRECTQTITLSVIKADIGGFVGHSAMHPALIEDCANEKLAAA
jgi:fructose 1,6-bisphosphate aldolase/phosphatase